MPMEADRLESFPPGVAAQLKTYVYRLIDPQNGEMFYVGKGQGDRASGQIWIDGNVITYRSEVWGNWDLPVAELQILGEATNQCGPYADDYFFCFAIGPGLWLEASFYAKGRDEFLRALGTQLRTSLEPGLCNSANFASRILWPSRLAGRDMFQYKNVPSRGFLGRMIGATKTIQTYTEEVAVALAVDGEPPAAPAWRASRALR